MDTATTVTELSAADRCDRCGAQAYVRVLLTSGQDLIFCAHHFSEHSTVLSGIAAEVIDESHRLAQN
ncbi:MAG: hypothetical protein U0990_05095 [Candidatus Nanopelagicales bacterium]|nr:hypothetical protein [Candidatus Nanopelagicales bacterium]MDZ4249450.1 hypothetical protein [Candidatus Nanopelagicales bacterium]MDZ7576840.1 hypothetical protein [Candidatus Nanopelagicales bacterium]